MICVDQISDVESDGSLKTIIRCKCGARLFDVNHDFRGFCKLVIKCDRCKKIVVVQIKN